MSLAARKIQSKQGDAFKKSATTPVNVLPAPDLAFHAAKGSAGLRKVIIACIGHSKPKKPVSFVSVPYTAC